jgi:hypothetical protein
MIRQTIQAAAVVAATPAAVVAPRRSVTQQPQLRQAVAAVQASSA